LDLSKELISKWLQEYMFKDRQNKMELANNIANYLSDNKKFKTHSRHIGRQEAKGLNLVIEDLEADQEVQDLVLSIYHATTHTFNGSGAVKIIENHLGKAYVGMGPVVQTPQSIPPTPTQNQ
jgi:hypothetical protein